MMMAAFTVALFWFSPSALAFFGEVSDPRTLAMGSAGSADPRGVESFHLNPASLAHIRNHRELSAIRQILDESSRADRITYGQHMRTGGGLGLTFSQMVDESIQQRDDQGALKGFFDFRQRELNLGYGWFGSSRIALGGVWKYRSESYPGSEATGRALDFGIMADLASNFRAGLVLRNLDASMKSDSAAGSFTKFLDQEIGLGLSWKRGLTILDMEAGKKESDTWRFRAGVEKSFGDALALRAGWDSENVTLGCGIRIKNMFFDYAYLPGSLESRALISMKLKFYRLDFFRELTGGKKAEQSGPALYEANADMVTVLDGKLTAAISSSDFREAEVVLLKLMSIEPNNFSWPLKLADIRVRTGDLKGARLVFQNISSRTLDPGLATQTRKAVRDIDALLFTKAAASLSSGEMPEAAAGHIALAELALAQKKYASAIVSLNNAMAVAGPDPVLLLKRSMALIGIDSTGEAVVDLEHIIAISDSPEICREARLLLEDIGRRGGLIGNRDPASASGIAAPARTGHDDSFSNYDKSPGEIVEGI
jgi:hypothetical protein